MDPIIKEKKIFVTHVNIRQSIFFLLLKLFLLDLLFVSIVLVFFTASTFSSLPNELKLQLISYSRIYFVILVLSKIFLTTYVVLLWLNEYYEIRPDMVVHRRGIFWRKEEHYPLKQIRAVKIQQGVLGSIFQYGTLTLYDWDLSKYAMLYLIHNPMKYLHVLENLLPRASREKEVIREELIEKEE